MTCPFAHDDGPYVLGALSPSERRDFERHLPGCADCSRAVGELAGLPGLLGRVDAGLLEQPAIDDAVPNDPVPNDPVPNDPVPDTLLPALSRGVARARRRRTLAAVGVAAAAVLGIVAPVTAWQLQADQSTAPSAAVHAMHPVGDVPVRATLSLERVDWGTRLRLTCTYDAAAVAYHLPPAVDYTIFVHTRDGRVEQVGSWRSVDGRPMRVTAATAATPAELTSVEVRTLDGRVVLRLAT